MLVYISLKKVMSTNIVKLRLLTSIRIHLVVNLSQVVRYRELVEEQKVEEVKLIKVKAVKEWEFEKILNKQKIRRVVKYIVCWKGFISKHNK